MVIQGTCDERFAQVGEVFAANFEPRGGWGGSLAVVDLDARMNFDYVMNKMGEGTVGDMRGTGLLMAACQSLVHL